MTCNILFVAYLWEPVCILTNIDPVYKLYKIYYPVLLTNMFSEYTLAATRFMVIQHVVTECCRISLTINITSLTILKTFMNTLKILRSRPLNRQTILLYNQLNCINVVVFDIWRGFNAMIQGFMFVIIVVFNWLVISGLGLVGLEIYAICFILDIFLNALLILVLHWYCQLAELSREVIQSWRSNTHRQTDSRKYFVRLIKAQQPVTLCYVTTKFDNETQSNYFNNFVNYTVNAILLC